MNLSNEIMIISTDELIPYDNNVKLHKNNVELIANSIKSFGFKQPILIDKNYIVIAGHGRLLASKKLGLPEVPVIIADDLTETQVKALRLADNKVSESPYDEALLQLELEQLSTSDYDMELFGFSDAELVEEEDDEKYTRKLDIPQYEMKGEQPLLEDLVNTKKTDELVAEIEKSKVPDDIKEFLKLGAQRHLTFNYSRIAEYYAHADIETQQLIENSVMVIIDFEDAIKNGYTTLEGQLEMLREDDIDD